MATQVDSHSDMAHARQSDGINVIFDQKSPGSSRSRSRSVSSTASSQSTGSGYRREIRRGRYRSSSRSSSSSSSRSRSSSRSGSRSRSRSYPRCHRRSSCCRCDDHRSYGGDRYRRSPPRRYRAHSRSYSRSPSRRYRGGSRSYSRSPPRRYRVHSRSPSSDRYSRHRRNYRSRSRSWSPVSWSRYRRPVSQLRCRFSRSPSRTYRGRSRSRSSGRSVSLSVHDKRELLEVAKANAMRMLGVEKLDLPESVKPILSDKPEARGSSPEPFTRVRHGSQKIEDEAEPGESSPRMESRKIVFSVHNSVAKPTAVVPSPAKVTPRVDSVESRKPYGHWIPISSGRHSNPSKHALAI